MTPETPASEIAYTPKGASDLERVFGPKRIGDWLPPMSAIPQEFKHHRGTHWNTVVCDWFFRGLKHIKASPKDGIDKDKALNHIAVCLVSYEPSQEHKEAGCAYLLSLWFDSFEYTKAK